MSPFFVSLSLAECVSRQESAPFARCVFSRPFIEGVSFDSVNEPFTVSFLTFKAGNRRLLNGLGVVACYVYSLSFLSLLLSGKFYDIVVISFLFSLPFIFHSRVCSVVVVVLAIRRLCFRRVISQTRAACFLHPTPPRPTPPLPARGRSRAARYRVASIRYYLRAIHRRCLHTHTIILLLCTPHPPRCLRVRAFRFWIFSGFRSLQCRSVVPPPGLRGDGAVLSTSVLLFRLISYGAGVGTWAPPARATVPFVSR